MRQSRQRDSVRLLQELTPHLRAARTVERELDRHLARRFNVFRYLRDDERGLSRIIADLLDPAAEHGQGTTFLEAMLELLGLGLRPTATDRIRVVQERGIPGGRRIDITVDIPTSDGLFCVAFENKPYAKDQPGQCMDYLDFLDDRYGKRFLLTYLPPRYQMPDESSLPPAARERWQKQFRVLPYVADDAPRVSDDAPDESGAADAPPESLGDGTSLADWFGTCCTLSDAERLRWFLREAQLFCREHFRWYWNMTDTEARYVREYLHQNPKHLDAAFAVARAWHDVKHDVSRRFLEHLRDRVGERVRERFPEIAGVQDVGCVYGGDKRWSNRLRLGRTIQLESDGPGPNGWYWGVRDPNPPERREELLVALKRRGLSLQRASAGWPQYEYLPRHGHWERLVPELVQELADGGGKVTEYYVNGLLKIAEKAIPAYDEVEQP